MRAAAPRALGWVCAAALAVVCLPRVAAAQSASEPSFGVGARLGGGYNRLSRPTDPRGEPTLLFGSAFSGPAITGGAAGWWRATRLGPLGLTLELDLLYSWHQGVGFAQDTEAGQRQTIWLRAHMLRVPMRVGLRTGGAGRVQGRLALGPELLVGVASGARVRNEGLEQQAPALETTPAVHLGLGGLIGAAIQLGPVTVPLEARLVWDPMVADSTRGRFQGYQSLEEPGAYQAAFDLQVLFTVGVEWGI